MRILIYDNTLLETKHLKSTSAEERKVQQWWEQQTGKKLPPIKVVGIYDNDWCECYTHTEVNGQYQWVAVVDTPADTQELVTLIQSL